VTVVAPEPSDRGVQISRDALGSSAWPVSTVVFFHGGSGFVELTTNFGRLLRAVATTLSGSGTWLQYVYIMP
jgi:hypothetical protein